MNHNQEQSDDERDAAGEAFGYDMSGFIALRNELKMMIGQLDGYRTSLNNLRVTADAMGISLEHERRENATVRASLSEMEGEIAALKSAVRECYDIGSCTDELYSAWRGANESRIKNLCDYELAPTQAQPTNSDGGK